MWNDLLKVKLIYMREEVWELGMVCKQAFGWINGVGKCLSKTNSLIFLRLAMNRIVLFIQWEWEIISASLSKDGCIKSYKSNWGQCKLFYSDVALMTIRIRQNGIGRNRVYSQSNQYTNIYVEMKLGWILSISRKLSYLWRWIFSCGLPFRKPYW